MVYAVRIVVLLRAARDLWSCWDVVGGVGNCHPPTADFLGADLSRNEKVFFFDCVSYSISSYRFTPHRRRRALSFRCHTALIVIIPREQQPIRRATTPIRRASSGLNPSVRLSWPVSVRAWSLADLTDLRLLTLRTFIKTTTPSKSNVFWKRRRKSRKNWPKQRKSWPRPRKSWKRCREGRRWARPQPLFRPWSPAAFPPRPLFFAATPLQRRAGGADNNKRRAGDDRTRTPVREGRSLLVGGCSPPFTRAGVAAALRRPLWKEDDADREPPST